MEEHPGPGFYVLFHSEGGVSGAKVGVLGVERRAGKLNGKKWSQGRERKKNQRVSKGE